MVASKQYAESFKLMKLALGFHSSLWANYVTIRPVRQSKDEFEREHPSGIVCWSLTFRTGWQEGGKHGT